MTKDVIIRKKQGRGQGADGFQDGISEPSVSKDATSARMVAAGSGADVREQIVVVHFVAPPTDDCFSFAIRSASRGNLVRE
jgi:hypothetical protein